MKKAWVLILIAAMMLLSVLPAAATKPSEAMGELIYEESFDHEDQADHNATLTALGWIAQTKAMGAYTDPSATLRLEKGRLVVAGASDTYFLILDEEEMAPYDGQTITIQYEMEYTTASDTSRYFTVLGNYAGKRYNSFHFRNRGTGNNQVHFDNNWLTYDAYRAETDARADADDTGSGSSIAMKLLGRPYDGSGIFSGLPVTVRYVLDPVNGTSVYMKLAIDAEEDFVLVSKHDAAGNGSATYGSWDANAICLKIGGTQNGYIDHIAVWTGAGDYPVEPEPEPAETTPAETTAEPVEPEEPTQEDPTENEEPEEPAEPEKVKEPQTIVNKIALWGVALFGGWILLKKGKEEQAE